MKSFRWLAMLALTLLIASLVSAAPLQAAEASVILPASITGPSACPPPSANDKLPLLNPAAQQASTINCGSCSVTVCQGAAYNSICQGGTQIKHCIAAYGNNCNDGTWQCQCWSGPLP
ncbi:MAG TPA: hypothetical protein VH988_25565 [Thermoanaerobaculia bacterium]|nr:hypothetical protein [Thermoanaerobaculia bacterium]